MFGSHEGKHEDNVDVWFKLCRFMQLSQRKGFCNNTHDLLQDEVKNEINVMNQLNHVNLIQLYDAFESKNDIVLVMEQ